MQCAILHENAGAGTEKIVVTEIPAPRFCRLISLGRIFYQGCFDSKATDEFRFYFYSPSSSRDSDEAKFVQRRVGKIAGSKRKKKLKVSVPNSCVMGISCMMLV